MKRTIVWLALVALIASMLAGCSGKDAESDSPAETSASPVPASDAQIPDGFDAIPTEGAGESAALAAVPSALEAGKAMREGAGLAWPDLTGLSPTLVAYLVRADYDGQVALFEVRADGIAHNMYAYQKAFDSGSIIWTAAENSQGPTAAPQSDREKAAVTAIEAAMADAFPGETVAVSVHGYRFVYLSGGTVVLALEVDPEGGVISVGN